LERLAQGPVIGDGGFVFALEKRGYVKAGPWTPESAVEDPEAVRQLHREFLRAGSDVMQAFTFYASEDKLTNRGNKAGKTIGVEAINRAASKLAKEVADEGGALTLGGLSQCPTYLSGMSKADVQKEFKKQIDVFVSEGLDFLLCEYFEHIEEIEWAIEECLKTSLPVAANMCQPLAFHTPDAGKQGFIDLPEFPFGLEPRICTRWDMHKFAREAWELGVRYIGGCCGFEPYHIRALAEELAVEKGGKKPAGSEKHMMWGEGLEMHTKPWVRARARRAYWENMKPASGRPFCPSMSCPDNWGVTKGDAILVQQQEATRKEQIEEVQKIQMEKLKM